MTQAVHRFGPIIGVQRRFMELGRIRLGDQAVSRGKTVPRKLTKFRLTSASRQLLDEAAKVYGGTVRKWENAPDEGYWELYTETDALDIILPPVFSDRDGSPTLPYSQAYELWSGGGCQRRCDGETEVLSGKACLCGDKRGTDPKTTCQIVTRLNVMLPKIPGLGVWRMESRGWNAASLLPGTLDLLMLAASQSKFIPAVLRLEPRTSKKGGQTLKFVVPVIDLPEFRIGEVIERGLSATELTQPLTINTPAPSPQRPELPATELPEEAEALIEQDPPLGNAPEIEPPDESDEVDEVDEVDDTLVTLRDQLLRLVDEFGAHDSIPAVERHFAEGDEAWLRRQVYNLTGALERRRSAEGTASAAGSPVPSSGTPAPSADESHDSSYFANRAAEAQARRQARKRTR